MGKHRDDDRNADWEGGKVGGRPGREHPNGWNSGRDNNNEAPAPAGEREKVYGWGPDGVEGWH